jgi:hypothetical protein
MNESLEFKIKTNLYKVNDVRAGHFIDFEKMKASLSNGLYGSMFRMGTVASDEALTMIDAESFFSVFSPKTLEDLNCKSFRDLGLKDYQEIKKVYIEQIVPWYNGYLKLLMPEQKKEEETAKE